jgi:hypothetical protein
MKLSGLLLCQIVNANGVPVSNKLYQDLELAEQECNNLVENYNEYHGVMILKVK